MRKLKPAWHHRACTMALASVLTACSGGGGGNTSEAPIIGASPTPTPGATATPTPSPSASGTPAPTPSPTPTPTPSAASTSGPASIGSPQQAALFLNYATFGATKSEMLNIEGRSTAEWVRDEMAKSPTLLLPQYQARNNSGEDLNKRTFEREIWSTMINSDDQLRQRMVFALSQILVVDDGDFTYQMAYYYDILSRNAFGNYRDLLQDVTYSPRMADYLTYLENRGDQEEEGRMPDENYARELLQLFTIGLVELNMDGTPKLDPQGQPVEIYDNTDIMGLARVFTGLSRNGGNYWSSGPDGRHTPLVMWDQYHSPHEKTFLGLTISEGTGGEESISRALDQIFAHPNVAPFISRQLIQRFTGSNPHPAYVKRVATAFETGQYISRDGVEIGTGERGDLGATIAAVLLDETLLLNTSDVPVTDGKIREPALRFIQFARAFDMRNADSGNEQWLGDTSSPATRLGQHPFRSPSVFNFYRPGYIAPATETGEAGLTAPEFQIVNASSYIGYSNFMANYIQDRTSRYNKDVNTFEPDYTVEMSLADSPTELVNHLDTLLTGGRMLEGTRANIIDAVDDLPFDADASSDQQEEERLKRVELAIMMATSSPSYFIQR